MMKVLLALVVGFVSAQQNTHKILD